MNLVWTMEMGIGSPAVAGSRPVVAGWERMSRSRGIPSRRCGTGKGEGKGRGARDKGPSGGEEGASGGSMVSNVSEGSG